MFKKITKLCLLLLLASFPAMAQNIFVTVVEDATASPLSFTPVNIFPENNRVAGVSVLTNDDGTANLKATAFPCTIEVAAIGYEKTAQTLYAYPANPHLIIRLSRRVNSLHEVVVTGTARPTQVQNALSQYRVISKAAIQAQGNITLADALNTQLNMNLSNDGVLGTNMRMQGLSGDKVKILVDGMPLNGRENGNIDLGQISLNNVDHIEIVQGPMSVVYGSDAIGGVINLITKKNVKPFEVQAGLNYESVAKYNVDVSGSYRFSKRSQASLGLARNFFDGWKYNDTLYVDPSSKAVFPRHRSLLFKPKEQYIANLAYNYTAPSGFKLQLASDLTSEKVTNRMAPNRYDAYGAFADDEYYRTKRWQTRLLMDGKLGKNGHWQSQNAYSLYYRVKNSYVTDLVTLSQTLNQSQDGAQDTSRFDDINLRSSYSNKLGKINYTAGYDIALQYAHSQKISDENRQIADYAAYGNLSMPFFKEKLTAQLGLRAAYNTRYTSPVIPSFNLLYRAGDDVQIRASYARGFRTPSLKELYLEFIDLNHHITGNDNLKAESADHYQASASWQFYRSGSDYAQLIATGYYNDVTNGIALVNQDTANPNSINYTYGNITRVQNTIANLQTEIQLRNVNIQLGYGFNHTFAQPGQYSAFDVHDITANMQYNWIKKKLHFSLFYKLTGSQPALQSNIDGSASYNGRLPAYSMMDASVERKFWNRKLQVILGVKNMLNVQSLNAAGATAVNMGPHGGSSQLDMLPRRIFTTFRLTID